MRSLGFRNGAGTSARVPTFLAAAAKISVVIPVYGTGALLPACLEALDLQTTDNFQTIVVDSSPDRSAVADLEARFPRVTFTQLDERTPVHAARNAGVPSSPGELIAFTDPD